MSHNATLLRGSPYHRSPLWHWIRRKPWLLRRKLPQCGKNIVPAGAVSWSTSQQCTCLLEPFELGTFCTTSCGSFNLLIVDSSAITKIEFASGSAPKLEKIIWSFTRGTVGSLSGIGNLPKLKELEFNGELIPVELKEERRPCLKVAARRGTPGRKEEVRQEGACSDGDAFRAPPYTAAPAASCHGSPLRWAELAKANHHLVSHALADQPPSPGSSDCHLTVSPEMGSSATA
uniref:Uncharacterized protein n=1 Tax=Aegilops tauschii subsp. strangulata TaxID=200361 RepID=A0A453QJ74_AEGTS